jgi:hypothetical protein
LQRLVIGLAFEIVLFLKLWWLYATAVWFSLPL